MLSAMGSRLFGQVLVFRAGGFCGGRCAASVLCHRNGRPARVLGRHARYGFSGLGAGSFNRRSRWAAGSPAWPVVARPGAVLRDWAQGPLIAIRGGRLVLQE